MKFKSKQNIINAFKEIVIPTEACACKKDSDPSWGYKQRNFLLNANLLKPFLQDQSDCLSNCSMAKKREQKFDEKNVSQLQKCSKQMNELMS